MNNQTPNSNNQIITKHQIPITQCPRLVNWLLAIGIYLVFGIWSLVIVGCGGESVDPTPPISFSESKGDVGYIHLSISNSQSPSQLKKATIAKYQIILEGEGLTTKEQFFSAQANGAVIEGIPVGSHRHIRVFALNEEGKILREGEVENLEIEGGKTLDIAIILQAIPVFLNVSDGDYLSNQRLRFELLTDPGHPIVVETDRALTDRVTSLSQIPANEKGELKFYPGFFLAGEHHFTARDAETGKTSSIHLNLWDGSQRKAAPLLASSGVEGGKPTVISRRVGQPLGRESLSSTTGGEFFPNVAEALWNAR